MIFFKVERFDLTIQNLTIWFFKTLYPVHVHIRMGFTRLLPLLFLGVNINISPL